MDKGLRILFITMPHRDKPDNFPPYGVLTVITSLRRAGYHDVSFYNMDVLRPSRQEALDHIFTLQPDVLAISSPVSTGYEGCKFFSLETKKLLPNTTVILGGNLAASSEIILKRTGVDFCFLGEGEIVINQFLEKYFPARKKADIRAVKGLAFLDDGDLVVTGYGEQLPAEEIFEVDWDIMDSQSAAIYFPRIRDFDPHSTTLKSFFPEYTEFESIPRERLEKTLGVLPCSKGCFNRCSYCHRFIKGIRFVPPEKVIRRIEEMIARFNVGAIILADECFGASRKWLERFCELIKPLDLLWRVGGMRVDVVSPEIIEMMKDAGCRVVIYGMESGSERILKVMEKGVSLEQNIDAARWSVTAGLYTIVQLVIGMPGEEPSTIEETGRYTGDVLTLSPSLSPLDVSINFAQALPGTPLYEYGRSVGLVGAGEEEEERYLLAISDRNAADIETTLNFTAYPRLLLQSWVWQIISIVNYMYLKRFGEGQYLKAVFPDIRNPTLWELVRRKKFGRLLYRYPVLTYRLRPFLRVLTLFKVARSAGVGKSLAMMKEYLVYLLPFTRKSFGEYKSLRRVLEEDVYTPYSGSSEMVQLRKGR